MNQRASLNFNQRAGQNLIVQPGVESEYDKPLDVLVCEPSDEMLFAAIRARGALFEGSLKPREAQKEHQTMVAALKEEGAKVYDIKDLLLSGLYNEAGEATERLYLLRNLLFHTLHYNYDRDIGLEERIKSEVDRRASVDQFSPEEMVKLLLLQPLVTVSYSPEGNMDTLNGISLEPLYNLMFMRDQMITTPKGVVLGKMNSRQRRTETIIVRFALGGLGIEPVYEIIGEGRLEGGDYIPTRDIISIGSREKEAVYLGNGLRTNKQATEQLLQNFNKIFGDKMLAVVTDPRPDQDHMHLDTYMNIVGPKKVMIDESRLNACPEDAPQVRIYECGLGGKGVPVLYEGGAVSMPIGDFLEQQGYDVIPLTPEMQAAYGINVLTVGEGKILGVDISAKEGFKHQLSQNQRVAAGALAKILSLSASDDYQRISREYIGRLTNHGVRPEDISLLPFNNLNQAYGSIHCLTQVIRRG